MAQLQIPPGASEYNHVFVGVEPQLKAYASKNMTPLRKTLHYFPNDFSINIHIWEKLW